MVEIEFHPEAIKELDDSAEWYMQRSQLAAKGFALAVDVALKKISDNPDRFPTLGRRFRACNLEHYPFQIVFQLGGDRLVIVAVAHAKRRPGYWRGRSLPDPA